MSIEELKLTFCKNETLINDLKETKHNLESRLKELVKEINELEEFKQYSNDSESEEKRLKLINTEQSKEFLEKREKLDNIKKKLQEEEMKLTEQEFEELLNQAQCNHLFYNVDGKEKVCIKCNRVAGTKDKENPHDIKELRLAYLYTEFSSLENEAEQVTEFLQNETLEHLMVLTKKILRIYKNINNAELQRKLEEKISVENLEYINAMYESIEDMPEDTKESYNSYKNRLKR